MLLPQNLKITLNIISIFLAAFFIAPSAAIVASWNALPGDQLYPTKRTLEKIALAVTAPNYGTQSSLQSKLIARRTDEATDILLKKSSTQGLDELRAQAATLRAQIASAPNATSKHNAAVKAVTELKRTKSKLKATRYTLAARPTIVYQTTIINNTIINSIEDTEEEIEDTIDTIEEDPEVGPLSIPDPSPSPLPSLPPINPNSYPNSSAPATQSPSPTPTNSPGSNSNSSSNSNSNRPSTPNEDSSPSASQDD